MPPRRPPADRAGREPAGSRGTGGDVIEEDTRMLRHERCAEPPVGDLAGQLEAARRQRSEIDRDLGPGARRGTERLALSSRPRQLVDLALVGHALAPHGAAYDLHELAQARQRALEGD